MNLLTEYFFSIKNKTFFFFISIMDLNKIISKRWKKKKKKKKKKKVILYFEKVNNFYNKIIIYNGKGE